MSEKSQRKFMKELGKYMCLKNNNVKINGEQYLTGASRLLLYKGAVFLAELAKDLNLNRYTVSASPMGFTAHIALHLYGTWTDFGPGIYLCIREPLFGDCCIMYCEKKGQINETDGLSRYLGHKCLSDGNYSLLKNSLIEFRGEYERKPA